MKFHFSMFSIFLLLFGCQYYLFVPKHRVVFEREGFVICGYDNRWYFFPTDPCVAFGSKPIGVGFPVNDLIQMGPLCEKALPITAWVPGSENKVEMILYVAPVDIRYCYKREAEYGQETIVLKGQKLLLNYRNLRDLNLIEIEPSRCEPRDRN